MDKIYHVEGTEILVIWQKILPNVKDALPDKVVIFFPGWAFRADTKTMIRIGENFANNFECVTCIIYTRSIQVISDSLYQEAKAVCMFIKESQVKEITLVGYSQGSIKAIDTSVLLQEMHPDIYINGLILISSVGLSETGKGELVRRLTVEILIKSLLSIITGNARKPSLRNKIIFLVENIAIANRALIDLFLSILIEIRTSKQNYFSRVKNELNEMAKRNSYLDQIQVPILLIEGIKDHVSDHKIIVAQSLTKAIRNRFQDNRPGDLPKLDKNIRNKLLSECLFPQSCYIKNGESRKIWHPCITSSPIKISCSSFIISFAKITEKT